MPPRTVWLLFPAQLYCGQSLLDGRRESIIIDYAFTTSRGLSTGRHPTRWAGVRACRSATRSAWCGPASISGRAYINRAFVLNFTLPNEDVERRRRRRSLPAATLGEDCRPDAEQISAATD